MMPDGPGGRPTTLGQEVSCPTTRLRRQWPTSHLEFCRLQAVLVP